MDNNITFFHTSPSETRNDNIISLAKTIRELSTDATCSSPLNFKRITQTDMPEIWNYLLMEKGRTTDFSYGGILMWVDFFNYEYTIYKNTLFTKGVVENDLAKPAFSLPIGEMPLKESVQLLKEYCKENNFSLEFSAVPEYAANEMKKLNPTAVEELTDWGDYLYDVLVLATLKGKKMSKKRNHVNQFISRYPDWRAVDLTPHNADEAMAFMEIFDAEKDSSNMAKAESQLSRKLINYVKNGDRHLLGMILYSNGEICAFTIGDIKGDTLFIHVEKASRSVRGSYEMINYMFAKKMSETHPEIMYINREDDSGDHGLRAAKMSYHPKEILKKFNISF